MGFNKPKINFSFSSKGEAAHHISKRMTQQTVKDKTKYSRKVKHKGNEQ